MPDPAHALTLQFLAWVAEGPRTYAQAMDAWRSTCPRLSIWEDAILDGLVSFAGGATRNQSRVTLTAKGRALLDSDAPAARAKGTYKGTDKGTDQGTDKGIRKEARTPARAALAR